MSRMTRVLLDIEHERERQQEKGWTAAHDDQHTTSEFAALIEQRTAALRAFGPDAFGTVADGDAASYLLVQTAALAVAAIESLQRRYQSVWESQGLVR